MIRDIGPVEIWAGAAWKETAAVWLDPGQAGPVPPTKIVTERLELGFGRRRLEIIPLPGHSEDSLAVRIDATWLYVADSILLTNDGRPLLPSVHARPIRKHIGAIEELRSYLGDIFIPGHGAVMTDRRERERDLTNRLHYLAAIAEAPGGIGFDEAIADCDPPFHGREWHEHNYR